MSDTRSRKTAVVSSEDRNAKARGSIAADELRQERNGAMVGIAAGGFGRSAHGDGWFAKLISVLPYLLVGGFAVLMLYGLALAVS